MLPTKTATHLITNTVPMTILAELVILRNRTKLHQTLISSRPFGLDEYVIGCPVDQLQIEMALDPENFMERGFHG